MLSAEGLKLAHLQTYRTLLRAATYLPDPFARSYVHNHIASSYRKSVNKSAEIREKRLKIARSECRTLERAGLGSLDHLRKVLLDVYGRKGPRRRQLIQKFLQTDESNLPADNESVGALLKGYTKRLEVFQWSPKFKAFIQSQKAHNPHDAHHQLTQSNVKLTLPEENSWGRPLPQKLAFNKRKEWWAELLRKFLPPLPQHDWDRLLSVVLDPQQIQIVALRNRAISPNGHTGIYRAREAERYSSFDRRYEGEEHAPLVPSGLAESFKRGILDKIKDQVVMESHGESLALIKSDQTESIRRDLLEKEAQKWRDIWTDRRVQRLYAGIWNLSATISQNPGENTWDIQWGGQRSRALNGAYTEPSQADLGLFEGLDGFSSPKPARKKEVQRYTNSEAMAEALDLAEKHERNSYISKGEGGERSPLGQRWCRLFTGVIEIRYPFAHALVQIPLLQSC